jgi:hypothetical protein
MDVPGIYRANTSQDLLSQSSTQERSHHSRVRSIQPVFFAIVDVENCSPFRSVLCEVLNHLHQSRNAHSVIGCTRSRRNGIIVCGEKGPAFVEILWFRTIDFYKDIGAFKVNTM